MLGDSTVWIRVTEKWEWSPKYGVTMVYKPGEYNVPSACATLAIAAGKAVRLRKVSRDAEPVEEEAAVTESDGG